MNKMPLTLVTCLLLAVVSRAASLDDKKKDLTSAKSDCVKITPYDVTLLKGDNPGRLTSYTSALAAFDKTWKVVDGGLADASLTVDIYKAYIDPDDKCCGGVELQLSYKAGANGPAPIPTNDAYKKDFDRILYGDAGNPLDTSKPITNAVWSQVLNTNDPSSTNQPRDKDGNQIDNPTNSNKGFPPPLYPYQYTGSYFYDKPERCCDQANNPITWTATAFLSNIDYTKKTITVFDGVSYGFKLECVPEPASLAVMGLGLAAVIRRRKR